MSHRRTRESLIGTWKLVTAVNEDLATRATTDFLGPHPIGYMHYSRDGRVMVINVQGDRAKPSGSSPTPREASTLFHSMLAYGGDYTIEGNEITHHVDISWNEVWTGSKQIQTFRFEGDRVHLSTKPSPDPASGRTCTRTMTWEKLK